VPQATLTRRDYFLINALTSWFFAVTLADNVAEVFKIRIEKALVEIHFVKFFKGLPRIGIIGIKL
jgi:hypothetical protein